MPLQEPIMGAPIMAEALLLMVRLNGLFGPEESVPVYWIYRATRLCQFVGF